ncbi:MAG TPA: FGGY-family carbohydrate kinase [Allocoleopsis sp.]
MQRSFLGIDFGTSGARAIVINGDRVIQAESSIRFEPHPDSQSSDASLTTSWQQTLFDLITQLPISLRQQICSIAINGTSSTVLVCDEQGIPLHAPLLYNDARGAAMVDQIKSIAPANHTVISATSSLAKLLWLAHQLDEHPKSKIQTLKSTYFLHQADWLSFLLHGKLGISDYHNALKLGYNVEALCYPAWLQALPISFHLPDVLAPGTPIAPLQPEIADRFSLPSECMVCAGTTDSIAAFLASGAQSPGEAVTSLGSTLVLKLLSQARVDRADYGIYSHRLGDLWLVGGASNTGGAVLQQFFSAAELQSLSQKINPDRPSALNYYPLLKPGERFPINDPHLAPCLQPRPTDSIEFLHGLLESIARIEAKGYQLLQDLGATPLTIVYTAGGGAQNQIWSQIRSRHLQVPVMISPHTEAAYGTALLAKTGFSLTIR